MTYSFYLKPIIAPKDFEVINNADAILDVMFILLLTDAYLFDA